MFDIWLHNEAHKLLVNNYKEHYRFYEVPKISLVSRLKLLLLGGN